MEEEEKAVEKEEEREKVLREDIKRIRNVRGQR
jgi:hypothetical protein